MHCEMQNAKCKMKNENLVKQWQRKGQIVKQRSRELHEKFPHVIHEVYALAHVNQNYMYVNRLSGKILTIIKSQTSL